MSYSANQELSKYHYLFNNENTCAETETKLYFISYIWDDDNILKIDKNNWQWLWCNISFQGINSTKALAYVLGKKGMYIKSCCVPRDKPRITRYQELHNYKKAQQGVLNEYSENIKSTITILHNESSSAIKFIIHRSSKSITSSNDTDISEMSSFSSE